MNDGFRARLRNGERLWGTMLSLPSGAVAEILADAGFDWLFVDAEHGALATSDLLAIMQAASRQVPCVVRVAAPDELPIKAALDLGAAGIIAPQVNTPERAAAVVRSARYAPAGARGVGLARAHGYGMRFAEYIESANERTAVIVQAEHALAVDNIEQIVEVDGVDAVLVGPYDLAASLGRMGQVHDPAVVAAIDHVTETCRAAGMPLGYFGVSADAVRPYVERGYTLIVAGVDTLYLGAGAKRLLTELQAID